MRRSISEAKQFLYLLRPERAEMLSTGPTEAEARAVEEHFDHLKSLTERGVVLLAGRTLNTDRSAFGIVLFLADSDEAARELMANDPAIRHGVMRAELLPYRVALAREDWRDLLVTGSRVSAGSRRKIYFSGSIRGGRDDVSIYRDLIAHLGRFGDVLTEQIGDEKLTATGGEDLPDEAIYTRDVGWVRNADLLVAEVTTPSLGVGYEIAVAEQSGVPILCLYRDAPGRRLSAMVAGNRRLTCSIYRNLDEAREAIDRFVAGAESDDSTPSGGTNRAP